MHLRLLHPKTFKVYEKDFAVYRPSDTYPYPISNLANWQFVLLPTLQKYQDEPACHVITSRGGTIVDDSYLLLVDIQKVCG